MTMIFQIEIPMICLQTVGVRIYLLSLLSYLITELSGGSVANAKAAKVSMIKLIHKSYTPENGDSLNMIEPIKTVTKTEILTVT
jgi:hypothetical protein